MDSNERSNLRVLFVGRDNPFNRGVCQWLDQNFQLVCVYFNEPNRGTRQNRWKKVRGRMKRYGIFRAFDELAFQVVAGPLRRIAKEPAKWRKKVDPSFLERTEVPCEEHVVANVHGKQWVERAKELDLDLIVAACGTVIYKKSFYEVPRLGTFVIHEGLTPEYKGLHTPIWAIMNGEPQYLGVTLLRIDDSIDGGEVLFQKRYEMAPDEGALSWSLVGHRAIITALPEMAESLRQLEHEPAFEPVDLSGRKSGYVTWMPLTRFAWLLAKNRKKIPLR